MVGAPRVLVVGNNTLDRVWTIRSELEPGRKLHASEIRCFAGGPAANVAFTLAALGVAVIYVGAFSSGLEGQYSRDSLVDVGILIDGCVVTDCPQHEAIVIVDGVSGERTILMHKDPKLRLDREQVRRTWPPDIDLVYIDNHEPNAALEAASAAREAGVPVLADLEIMDDHAREIVPMVSSLIAPARVVRDLGGCRDLAVALSAVQTMGPRVVVGTAGAAGAIGIQGHGPPVEIPARSCRVVDTTGAGDAFHAGYAAAVFAGQDFRRALETAAAIAAAKCQEPGPRLSPSAARALSVQLLETAPRAVSRRLDLL